MQKSHGRSHVAHGTSWESSHIWILSPWDSHVLCPLDPWDTHVEDIPHGKSIPPWGSHVKKVPHGRADPMWIFSHGDHLPCVTTVPSSNNSEFCLTFQIFLHNVYPYPNPRTNRWLRAVLGDFWRLRQGISHPDRGWTVWPILAIPRVFSAQVGDGGYEYAIIHGLPTPCR